MLSDLIESSEYPLIAVLTIDDIQDVKPLAETLLSCGITAIELTLRTASALSALQAISTQYPGILVGAGTVLTREQVCQVKDAGAAFGVAPGLNRNVLDEAQKQKLPFAPGIVTPSDIETALEYGCRIMKFFPAEPSGGLPYLNSMAAPYAHLNLQFIPLGGLHEENLRGWLESPLVCSVGGSWIAPRKLIQEKNWDEIRRRAQAAVRIAKETRKGI
ncbi:MAG: bifunctional 4-hydroxy-2-oxoglutarate aldolase/2-dehydro-3-deoxy-phosphogluconate aldolase [Kiritimatiellales bacterium]